MKYFAKIGSDLNYTGEYYTELSNEMLEEALKNNFGYIELDEPPVIQEAHEGINDNYGTPTPEQLKLSAISQINRKSRAYLESTDYYVMRFVETTEPIPDDIKVKRQAARDAIED